MKAGKGTKEKPGRPHINLYNSTPASMTSCDVLTAMQEQSNLNVDHCQCSECDYEFSEATSSST